MAETRDEALLAELRARSRRWLVTGAAGFIGSHLVEELLRRGQEVVGLDDLSSGSRANLEEALAAAGSGSAERFRFLEGDIRSAEECAEAVAGCEVVLHEAARVSVPESVANPHLTYRVNVGGFLNVLAAAKEAGVASVVYASSCAVYGDAKKLPASEEQPGKPLSPYAASKRMGEVAAETWALQSEMRLTGLRYFNAFGPRQDPSGGYAAVVPKWIQALIRGETPVVYGTGENTRDFCPVGNVVQANLLAALSRGGEEEGAARSRIFNVGLGERVSLLELFRELRDGLAARGAPCAGIEPVFEPVRSADILHSHADPRRAREELGFEPRVRYSDGLAETMDWFLAREAAR